MSTMKIGFAAAQTPIVPFTPFPVSEMEGAGRAAISRTGNDYYMWQDHGGGEWIRWKLEQFTLTGYTARTIAACDLVLASATVGGSGITLTGTWSGSAATTATCTTTDSYLEFTGTGQSLAFTFNMSGLGASIL